METIPDNIDFSGYEDEPESTHRILPGSNWVEEMIDGFYTVAEVAHVRLGWKKTHDDFYFRPAEVTLWAGINGHGKSQAVGQVVLDLMMQGQRACLASLEMRPAVSLRRMARQASGSRRPPVDFIHQFGKWTDGKLWIYDHFGSCSPRTMLAVIRYAVDKFKIDHFVIDNLMKVVDGDGGTEVYNGQKDFVDGLCKIASATGVHIHLILHAKKAKDENAPPGKFDIKGSGAITDLVDNIFIVWRNKLKEDSVRQGDHSMTQDPDMRLRLQKQRHGEGDENEGDYGFWFDPQSLQYLENRHDLAKLYSIGDGMLGQEVNF